MKSLLILLTSCTILTLTSCSSQVYMATESINQSVEQSDFTFNAKSVMPMSMDVINVINSIPGATSTRITTLDSGYGFDLKSGKLSANLPYFGRVYNASIGDYNKNSFRFESSDYRLSKTKNKKGNWVISIQVNDQQNSPSFILEIFKTGSALLSISANDRQPISYDGYISNASINH